MKKAGLTIFAVLALLVMLCMPISSGTISFVKELKVTDDTVEQRNMDMEVASTKNGTIIYLAYEELSSSGNIGSIIFKRSLDGGVTWDINKDLMSNKTGLNKQIQPSLDVQDDGQRLALVFMDSQYREIPNLVEYVIVCMISDDGGRTWKKSLVTPTSSIDYPSDDIKEPEIAMGPEGELVAAWIDLKGDDRVVASISVDDGRTWSDPVEAGVNGSVENPNFKQSHPSVACDGDLVHISLVEDSKYRPQVFYSRSKILNGSLSSFSTNLQMSRDLPVNYQSWYPVIDHESSGLHLAWWDFITDRSGANNEDYENDRPCIKYSRSLDNGSTWKVGKEKDLIINGSFTDAWISPPSLSASNGSLVIGWWDLSLDHPAVFISRSLDGGSIWSDPIRASSFRKGILMENLDVGITVKGEVATSWMEFGSTEDREILISTSAENVLPEPVSDLELVMVNETTGWVKWKPYTGPDLTSFTLFLSNDRDLPDRNVSYPEGSRYLDFIDQDLSMVQLMGLNEDSEYFCSLEKMDWSGNTVLSNIISFKTLPGNKPPNITTDIMDISIPEGSRSLIFMNISEMVQSGIIIDDFYNGIDELDFQMIPMKEHPMIEARVYHLNGHQYAELTVLDKNWYGSEEFRLKVTDPGWDGNFGNEDDLSTFSNIFKIEVFDVNDAPYWISWRESLSGYNVKMEPGQEELYLKQKVSACIEDLEYGFILKAEDIDGDLIKYSCSDDRVRIEQDAIDPRTTSRFIIKPGNDDLPTMDLVIKASDGRGGSRSLDLSIGIENTNDDPIFTGCNEKTLPPTGGTLDLTYIEGEELFFTITGSDPDPVWDLDLISQSDALEILKTGKGSFNISLDSEKSIDLPERSSTILELYDRDGGGPSILNLELDRIDVQNPPEWMDPDDPIVMIPMEDISEEDDEGQIGPEWNELVKFETAAMDPDGDPLEFHWTFTSIDQGSTENYSGENVEVRFHPEGVYKDTIYRVDLSVISVNSYLNHSINIVVKSDGDDDNDDLDDELEERFFGDLSQGPDDDPDGDGFSNIIEMHPFDGHVTDPTDGNDPPVRIDDDDDIYEERSGFNPMATIMLGGLLFTILAVAGGMVIIVRREKNIETEEDEDIERRVQAMKKRQDEITSLYGTMRTDADEFGPDQTTLDDIILETGEEVYHGQIMLKKETWDREENEKKRGPDETALSINGERPVFGIPLELTP